MVFQRSSVYKTGLMLSCCVGVIDSDFRSSISMIFNVGYGGCSPYKPGDRIGQIVFVPVPAVELVESDELSETERGAGGYGSTGK
jgi:dUTP pyrophosphatase